MKTACFNRQKIGDEVDGTTSEMWEIKLQSQHKNTKRKPSNEYRMSYREKNLKGSLLLPFLLFYIGVIDVVRESTL